MSISSVNTSAYPSGTWQSGMTGAAAQTDANGHAVGGHRRHHGGGQFMQALQQALSQSGIRLSDAGARNGAISSDAEGDEDAAGTATNMQAVRQDLHTLMHDLFAAMQPQGQQAGDQDGDDAAPATQAAGSVQSAYGNALGNQLDSLIRQLGAGSAASTGNSPLSLLQNDFQSLLNDASGTASAQAQAQAQAGAPSPSLQVFLQNFAQNLSGQRFGASGAGSLIDTQG